MATRTYKLYSATIGAASADASLRIVRKGRITSINWVTVGTAGAGTDWRKLYELSKQNTLSATTNDTPPTVIDYHCVNGNVSGGSFGANSLHAGMSNPVDVGDTLYLNTTASGVAPSGIWQVVVITVEES